MSSQAKGNPAVVAHLDDVEALGRAFVHPVLAFELGGHALDGALHAERLAAADAAERLFLLEDARAAACGAEIELRSQRDDLLGAGRLAQPALHAGVLGEAQHRPLRIIAQRAGRAGRHAGQAQGAAGDVDLDRPKGAARGAARHLRRAGAARCNSLQREAQHAAFFAERLEACRTRRGRQRGERAQRGTQARRDRPFRLSRRGQRRSLVRQGSDRPTPSSAQARKDHGAVARAGESASRDAP